MPTAKQTKKAKAKLPAGKSMTTKNSPATRKRKNTTPTYMKVFYGFMLLVLLMGSFARIARGRQTATPASSTPTPVPVSTPTPTPGAGDPDQVVRDFLTALEKDPSGQSGMPYLSLELQDAVTSGVSVKGFLGLETAFTSFDTEVLNAGQSGDAVIKATLNLVSPYEITFILSDETGAWHISQIQPQSKPANHSGG